MSETETDVQLPKGWEIEEVTDEDLAPEGGEDDCTGEVQA